MRPSIEEIRLSDGDLAQLLNDPDLEAVSEFIGEKPFLRGSVLRIIDQLQGAYAQLICDIVGEEGEKFLEASPDDLREANEAALRILKLTEAAELAADYDPKDPYQALLCPKMPEEPACQTIQETGLAEETFWPLMNTLPFYRLTAAACAHREVVGEQAKSDLVMERLKCFVELQGGEVRFDAYHEQHQMGELGFYSYQLDFSDPLGDISVNTPSNSTEGYAMQTAQNVFGYLKGHIVEEIRGGRKVADGPFVVAEIGGGGGQFKSAFLALVDGAVNAGAPFGVDFVSIDINHFQRLRQTMAGSRTQAGTATATGLEDGSVDLIFSEEVPDCFPHRWFRRKSPQGPIVDEAFVVLKDGQFSIDFKPIVRDAEVEKIEAHILSSGSELLHYRYSDQDDAYWAEVHRVLRPYGHHLMTDYTLEHMQRSRGDMTQLMHFPINVAFNDITRGIDPLWMRKLAEQRGFRTRMMFFDTSGQNQDQRFFLSGRKFD